MSMTAEETLPAEVASLEHVYLQPGHVFFTIRPSLVTTILGPSVAICLIDGNRRGAGMNHFLVPALLGANSPRYAPVANETLLAKFALEEIPTTALRAKVFGGSMMQSVRSDLAEKNVAAAREFLETANIRIETIDVGGIRARKLHFRALEGETWVQYL